ncbi:MAG: aldehyde dehydrogenase [Flavobacterium sp.]|uniref:aldehyde dehydrogenase n=1 Tax=Flavobacterium sp. TaxID=239 RepID=UPI0012011A01|nr:aldehyde dehydrogenase [Flavobacterium sp.]RZJ65850.1 MAG: aldehyde dehydrogenase [Flavobacterium sp.]
MNPKTTVGQRKETLKKLLHVLTVREDAIVKALYDDFKKPGFEAVLSETHFVMSELKQTIRNIKSWSRTEMVFPSILNFPSIDHLLKEPYGNVLIISPWNYPFHLAMLPTIAAYAAGNSVILKPSELTPNTSSLISQIVSEVFDPTDVEVFQGGSDVAEKLLERRWDYIFFTGSVSVGKKVAQAAAKNLTPVTLELGGKNPCIVAASANLKLAAKRIVWGKFINAGQTCIAPDYVLVESSIKTKFIQFLKDEIVLAYGENPQESADLARIVSEKHWQRLVDMIESEKVVHGGQYDKESLYVSPTIIDETNGKSELMKDEIFGPILPVLGYDSESDLDRIITLYEKPLSLYVFTDDSDFAKHIVKKYPFGGGCINDVVIHFANSRLPFGGVGHSGIGAYHGRRSFDTFTHKKAITRKATWLDIPLRYAPYGNKVEILRKWLKWL